MKTLLRLALLIALLAAALAPALSAQAEAPALTSARQSSPLALAQALLPKLTPEERVGQLFLVTFNGSDTNETTQIYDLVHNQHVGGVLLLAANNNFSPVGRTVSDAYALAGNLQTSEWSASQSFASDPVTGRSFKPNFIPLFIGTSQEGDGAPFDQMMNGVTQLPSPMSLGATWKVGLAQNAGEVLGSELQAIGFNLLLGPTLDVLELRQTTEGFSDLGTRTFGGDPYWVGEMGRAFLTGVHAGSNGRIAVIAKHFPGRGSSDRLPEEEVATVRKSLEQLKQIELAPFFTVTGSASNPPPAGGATDGLLVSHIRYQGFQGNIRETTRPVSFDSSALEQLMALPAFTTWRDTGGLVVADDLGSRAVRRFYDPTERIFDAPQVALDAFLAGNDLLYADNFVANGDPDPHATLIRTLSYFAQKYREDPAFAERVDASVLRILTLKYRLYPSFNLNTVIPAQDRLDNIGLNQQVTFEVARQAVTLISPAASELDLVLPKAPDTRENIVFFTDAIAYQQCSRCQQQTALAVDALQNAVLKLYGPLVGGRAQPDRLRSYAFADLRHYLRNEETPEDLESDLRGANWVVFSTLQASAARPESQALRDLLSMRPDLLRNKKVIVFAFNAPYYLDATDISKLTAYYGLFSKTPEFVDVAARVLYRELAPTGSLPVSVPGVGYDLIEATSPDPNQIIPLYLDLPLPNPVTEGTLTPEPTSVPTFKVGDSIPLKTGVISDHNHKQVPDGTVVTFTFTVGGENGSVRSVETQTVKGEARATYRIEKAGLLEIRVAADPARTSDILQLDVSGEGSAAITAIAPSPIPPTETPTVAPTFTASPTITPTVTPTPVPQPGVGDWALSMLGVVFGAGLAYIVGLWWLGAMRWGVRFALCAVLGGLAGYLYLALALPGSQAWIGESVANGALGAALIGVAVGWAAALAWWLVESQGGRKAIKTGTGPKSTG